MGTGHSQLLGMLNAILPDTTVGEKTLLSLTEGRESSEQFLNRHLSGCQFPIGVYDTQGQCQSDTVAAQNECVFPAEIRMPEKTANGCAFQFVSDALYFLYDRIDHWDDAPSHLSLIALRLEAGDITRHGSDQIGVALTNSEFILLAHLLSGHDLKTAADAIGVSYDTKRKQIQVVLDKLGFNSQTDMLRSLTMELTAQLLDTLLPAQSRNCESQLVRKQLGCDVVVHKVMVGDGGEVPLWEIGPRCGRPILYFHNMLSPIMPNDMMVPVLKRTNARLICVPRPFVEIDSYLSPDTRISRISQALGETMSYILTEPVICIADSAGVSWAANFAHHHPSKIDRMVLVATPQTRAMRNNAATVFAELSQRWRSDTRVLAGIARFYNMLARVPQLAERSLHHLHGYSEPDLDCINRLFQDKRLSDWLTLQSNHAPRAFADEFLNLQQDWPQLLRGINCPMTLIHGREDRISPLPDIEILAASLPDANLKTIKGAGHLLLFDHFESVLQTALAV